jgi:hypothetical protein
MISRMSEQTKCESYFSEEESSSSKKKKKEHKQAFVQ